MPAHRVDAATPRTPTRDLSAPCAWPGTGLLSDDRSAAVNHEGLTGDVATGVGCQKHCRTHEIRIATKFPERSLATHFITMPFDDYLRHLGWEHPGSERI